MYLVLKALGGLVPPKILKKKKLFSKICGFCFLWVTLFFTSHV